MGFGNRFGAGIKLVHRLADAHEGPGAGAGDDFLRQLGDLLALLGTEFAEDVVDELTFSVFVADADAQARVGRSAEELLDVLQAVVATGAAGGAQADGAEGEVDVVADNQEVVEGKVEFLLPVADGVAAQIHIRRRLEQVELAALVADDGHVAVAAGLENDIGCLGPGIQYHKADVVSRGGVFGTDVAESDHQIALL